MRGDAAACCSALLWLLDRWQVSRGVAFKSGLAMRPGWLLALCYLGAVSHPLLDLLTTYSVQLLSPFSAAWYHADGLFIIDLWLWLLLGGTIFWSKRREKAGRMAAAGAGRARRSRSPTSRLNLLISQSAYAAVRSWAGDAPGRSAVRLAAAGLFLAPRPRLARARLLPPGAASTRSAGFGAVSECEPTQHGRSDRPRRHRPRPAAAKFLRWSILPQAEVERGRCTVTVTIGDARYGEGRRSRLGRESTFRTC